MLKKTLKSSNINESFCVDLAFVQIIPGEGLICNSCYVYKFLLDLYIFLSPFMYPPLSATGVFDTVSILSIVKTRLFYLCQFLMSKVNTGAKKA